MTRRQASVINYHSVLPCAFPLTIAQHINIEIFESHIRHIANHYHCISLEALITQAKHNKITPKSLAITFDDGFYNNLTCALPILEHYNIPATIFIPTGYIDRKVLLWPENLATLLVLSDKPETTVSGNRYSIVTSEEKSATYRAITRLFKSFTAQEIEAIIHEMLIEQGLTINDIEISPYYENFRILSWEELDKLAHSDLITIGSHSVNHYRLQNTSDVDSQFEIQESKNILEKKVGPISFFAYPFGHYGTDYSDQHVEMVKRAGYHAAVSSGMGMVTTHIDSFQIPRPNIEATHTVRNLDYLLSGGPLFAKGIPPQRILKGIFSGRIN